MIYVNYKCKKIQLYANKNKIHNINSKVQLARDDKRMQDACNNHNTHNGCNSGRSSNCGFEKFHYAIAAITTLASSTQCHLDGSCLFNKCVF